MDLLAAVAIGFGVTFFLDLFEGLLRCAVNLELEDKDAFGRFGDEVRTAVGLPVLGGDAEEAAFGP